MSDPAKIAMAYALVAAGIAAAAFTIALLRDRMPPHDPHAVPFGDLPRLPDAAEEADRIWS